MQTMEEFIDNRLFCLLRHELLRDLQGALVDHEVPGARLALKL
jgi:hypothetical protein